MDETVLEPTREGTLEEIQNCRRKIRRASRPSSLRRGTRPPSTTGAPMVVVSASGAPAAPGSGWAADLFSQGQCPPAASRRRPRVDPRSAVPPLEGYSAGV